MYLSQSSFIYYPDRANFLECSRFKDYQKIVYNGTRFYYLNKSKEIIVFYHGNAGSACDRSILKALFEKNNRSVIFVEYAGYSNDVKSPSKNLILNDVKNIINFLAVTGYSNISVIGESIGTGAVAYHAYTGEVDSLVLLSPFDKLSNVAQTKYAFLPISLLLSEDFDNEKWLKNYSGRLVIIHGTNDIIIPIEFSKRLYEQLNTTKTYLAVENAGHNDLYTYKEVIKIIDGFLG
jgi:uncharacterized protein